MRLGEPPIALLDDTVWRSCKNGVVLTEAALYVLYDGRRVELARITDGPHYPQGDEHAGYLGTADGPFMVPNMGLKSTRAAFKRLVDLVHAWNRGDRASPLDGFKSAGRVSEAVVSCLFPCTKIMPIWRVPDEKMKEARAFLRGMDHAGGERPLAVIDETATGICDEGVVVTDRQVRWRSENPDVEMGLPYAWVSGASPGSAVFGKVLVVHAHHARHEIKLVTASEAIEPLGRFLGWIATLPPGDRWQPPSAAEPPLASAAYEARAIAVQSGSELDPALAADLSRRLDLAARNERFGRGAREGMWQSPLSLADLRYSLCAVLGEPLQRHWDGVTETLDFRLRQGGGAGGAILSSAVGIALFATVGFGWVSVPSGPTITTVRFGLREAPCGSVYSVHGLAGWQYLPSPAVEAQVDAGLLPIEREMLRRRIAFGALRDPREIGAWAPEPIAARLHELVSRAPTS